MIAILTDWGIGGTFLTWTVHYLSGDDQYFNSNTNSWVPLVNDPIGQTNAHNFKANQPTLLSEFLNIFESLTSLDDHAHQTIYFHHFESPDDTATAISQLAPTVNKTVLLCLGQPYRMYQCRYKPRWEWRRSFTDPSDTDPSTRVVGADAIYQQFVSTFFNESKKIFEQECLTDVWDQREFIALNKMACSGEYIEKYSNLVKGYHKIEAVDLWTTFELGVHPLFKYLGLEINEERFAIWQTVYAKWKQLHAVNLRFAYYFDTIVQYILQGKSFDLEQFDLDIVQEAAIQHVIMYKHNLNFKTWQLTKFTDTLQLHNLLEPCHHDLSKSKITSFDLANL